MEIKKFCDTYFGDVFNVVHTTIEEIYSKYYPRSAVDFYHNYHSRENMKNQIPNEYTLVLMDNCIIFGTGAVLKNEIRCFFILPEYQGKGYGKTLFKELEKNVNKELYDKYFLYASLASANFYLKNNYIYKKFCKEEMPDNKYLCYFEMEKHICKTVDKN